MRQTVLNVLIEGLKKQKIINGNVVDVQNLIENIEKELIPLEKEQFISTYICGHVKTHDTAENYFLETFSYFLVEDEKPYCPICKVATDRIKGLTLSDTLGIETSKWDCEECGTTYDTKGNDTKGYEYLNIIKLW